MLYAKDLSLMHVFPTPVGMNRFSVNKFAQGNGVPHTRGDEPDAVADYYALLVCSPHPWG